MPSAVGCHVTVKTDFYVRRIMGRPCGSRRVTPHLAGPLLVALPKGSACDPGFARHARFRSCPLLAAHPAIPLGGDAAGQSDRAAAPARIGACLCVLGLS